MRDRTERSDTRGDPRSGAGNRAPGYVDALSKGPVRILDGHSTVHKSDARELITRGDDGRSSRVNEVTVGLFDESCIIKQSTTGPERVVQRRTTVRELSGKSAVDELHD